MLCHGAGAAWRLAIALTAVTPMAASTLPCADRFVMGHDARTFDGAAYEVVTLHSETVSLSAFTFGAWMITEDPSSPYSLTLTHKQKHVVRIGVCPLSGPGVPSDAERWTLYVTTRAENLQLDPDTLEVADSTQDDTTVEIIDWPTREAEFSAPGSPFREIHVVASRGDIGVAFILFGPSKEVEEVEQDFRFFLSRLQRN